MHFQISPHEETKLVCCTRGAIYDVVLDLRQSSSTFRSWQAVELSAENSWGLYIPAGVAHGFQTLVDDTEVLYQISARYHPESARGVRWDDPGFGIHWPNCETRIVSERDRGFGAFASSWMEPLSEMIFWGATGQAKVLRDAVGQARRLVALFDNNALVASPFSDVPLYHGMAGFERWVATRSDTARVGFFVAIGGDGGNERLRLQELLGGRGLDPLVAIHPKAWVADGVSIGEGSQVLAGAIVCVGSRIGRACIVNTAASIDHECVIADGVHIGPGAHVAGCVEVARCATIYTGATIGPRVRIGEHAIVGAGAVVLSDVPPNTLVVGNPARAIRSVHYV
jgi:sugar O-acyltransferase (sialic acid O-acetyltransferase NeuD family)